MSDDEKVELARLSERLAALAERIAKLEKAQYWIATAIIGFVLMQLMKSIQVLQ